MRFPRKRGSTSNMVRVFIPDNSSTVGAGLTGLTNASTNLTIDYMRSLDGSLTSYSGANIEAQTTIGTYQAPSTSSKIRFKETPIAGIYELQFHDSATAFGSGDASDSVLINIREATTAALKIGPNAVLIPLVPWDYQDGVRMGLTGLANAAPGAAGGLATADDLATVDGIADAIKAKTDNLPAAPAATGDIPTAAQISDAVWSEATADHVAAGSTGAALTSAGSNTFVIPALTGRAYTAVAIQNRAVSIVQGDTPTISFDLGADYTGFTIRFGAKVAAGDALYAIGPVSGAWSNAATGVGYVTLSASDTDTAGTFEAEIELTSGSTVLTIMKFDLTVLKEVVTTP